MIPPNLSKEIRNKYREVRKDACRVVYIITEPETADCPNCISTSTGSSTGVKDPSFAEGATTVIFGQVITGTADFRGRCPICYGKGFLENESRTGIKAIVRWNPTDVNSRGDLVKTEGGIEGLNVVQVKADKCYYSTLRDAKKAIIDGIECSVLLPPVFRYIGNVDITVIAYFVSEEVGHGVRG